MTMQVKPEAERFEPPPIRVNDRVISQDEIAREVQYHPSPDLRKARARAARALVVRELLLAEADRLGISAGVMQHGETEDEARIRRLIAERIEVPDPTEADCRRYYESNQERLRTADEHEVSHILIPAPPDDAEIRAEARKKAMGLVETLRRQPDRFVSLARDFSSCPSADVGGHLGLIARGQTAPEFEKALSRLPIGEIPEYPVESRFGFHVVLVHQRREGRPVTFDSCREKIADYLREHVRRRAISQYIRVLAAEHEIEGIDLDAPETPLVQ
ncbi:MAG: peptidylprolyl isomerase [Gammaproteobacteria bacterium HGW-Gammaproteobacteria-8]|nr:MAG: peptidylprolyl isomerase [Gammaproteobacteria bacterium HGW-Gammaproteobacteria-8]